MADAFPPLPIDEVLSPLREALATRGTAVLVAPPGAGKTTRVPIHLLREPWSTGRILMLEPRRIAARAAATQIARLLGESVGETAGYRVRLESRTSARTRIEVATEGILTRMLQDDPSLDGFSAVVFDEFHERHLAADLGLALTLESRGALRDDLRVLVMSATLEAAPVAALLAADGASPAPVIVSEGRTHPVDTRWQPARDGVPIATAAANAVRALCVDAAMPGDGDILVFLPGVADLERTRRALDEAPAHGAPDVLLLHGGLTLADQDRVLRRDVAPGRRRVILSTAIAESSVTLEGVRAVVDSGFARVPRFSPRTGMTRLETVRVSRPSADQRRGRAGRTASGICVRLWDEGVHASLPSRAVPEILEADLAPLALDLAVAGVGDVMQLRWLDAPPVGALAQARALLRDLGALDGAGRVTPHGRAMAALGVAPRLAHLVLRAAEGGCATLGCEVAALLSERDILRREAAEHDADLRTRVELVRGQGRVSDADRGRLERVRQEARALRRLLGRSASDADDDVDRTGALVALAFPDRVAARRPGDEPRYLLRNGRGARLTSMQPMGRADQGAFLAIADLDGGGGEGRIWLAAPLDEAALRDVTRSSIVHERLAEWDDATQGLRAVERERLGAIVLRERPVRDADPSLFTSAILTRVREVGATAIPFRDAAQKLRARLAFAHQLMPDEFPDVSDDALLATLDEWLAPAISGARRMADLERVDLGAALLGRLPWSARAKLDDIAPTHLDVPSGSRIPVDYADPTAPVLAVRLQELFGLADTPRVGAGRVPVTLHLLSPANRPVQVTRDLANFWRTTYFDVRRDLKGRYPRHPWPDDPMAAPATRRAKPRGT